MAKHKTKFACTACGQLHPKWQGQCDGCGEWNTLVEEVTAADLSPQGQKVQNGRNIDFVPLQGEDAPLVRLQSGIAEFDRVCGGGLVPGGAVLIGGDPGIGKSTLLLQIAARLSQTNDVAYISGEESVGQIRMRAKRLGVHTSNVQLAAHSNVSDILKSLDHAKPPSLVVIDSIQTVYADVLPSAPGTVAQVRFCAQELVRLAKKRGFSLLLVGHVTKEGAMAGPKVLEHMVDTVLYFEGERGHAYRILRTNKNRFGAASEIGVFAMGEEGLSEVPNPSALFLQDRQASVSGSAVMAGIEGTRPILTEMQALIATSQFGMPKRSVIGWDANRLSMLLAVLETRAGISFAGKDIYLNIAGGMKVTEPAGDLAVAAALISALRNAPLPADVLFFGELGLSGEVRGVSHMPIRLKEAAKLGFKTAICPSVNSKDLSLHQCSHVKDLLNWFTDQPAKAAA